MTAVLPLAASRIRLPDAGPSVLAFGAHFKGSVCVTRGDEAFLSPDIGALDNADCCVLFDETVSRMLDAADVRPERVDRGSLDASQGYLERLTLATKRKPALGIDRGGLELTEALGEFVGRALRHQNGIVSSSTAAFASPATGGIFSPGGVTSMSKSFIGCG